MINSIAGVASISSLCFSTKMDYCTPKSPLCARVPPVVYQFPSLVAKLAKMKLGSSAVRQQEIVTIYLRFSEKLHLSPPLPTDHREANQKRC